MVRAGHVLQHEAHGVIIDRCVLTLTMHFFLSQLAASRGLHLHHITAWLSLPSGNSLQDAAKLRDAQRFISLACNAQAKGICGILPLPFPPCPFPKTRKSQSGNGSFAPRYVHNGLPKICRTLAAASMAPIMGL